MIESFSIFVLGLCIGICIGNGIRLMYHCITGRDIPIYKPKSEIVRLRAEANKIEQIITGKSIE